MNQISIMDDEIVRTGTLLVLQKGLIHIWKKRRAELSADMLFLYPPGAEEAEYIVDIQQIKGVEWYENKKKGSRFDVTVHSTGALEGKISRMNSLRRKKKSKTSRIIYKLRGQDAEDAQEWCQFITELVQKDVRTQIRKERDTIKSFKNSEMRRIAVFDFFDPEEIKQDCVDDMGDDFDRFQAEHESKTTVRFIETEEVKNSHAVKDAVMSYISDYEQQIQNPQESTGLVKSLSLKLKSSDIKRKRRGSLIYDPPEEHSSIDQLRGYISTLDNDVQVIEFLFDAMTSTRIGQSMSGDRMAFADYLKLPLRECAVMELLAMSAKGHNIETIGEAIVCVGNPIISAYGLSICWEMLHTALLHNHMCLPPDAIDDEYYPCEACQSTANRLLCILKHNINREMFSVILCILVQGRWSLLDGLDVECFNQNVRQPAIWSILFKMIAATITQSRLVDEVLTEVSTLLLENATNGDILAKQNGLIEFFTPILIEYHNDDKSTDIYQKTLMLASVVHVRAMQFNPNDFKDLIEETYTLAYKSGMARNVFVEFLLRTLKKVTKKKHINLPTVIPDERNTYPWRNLVALIQLSLRFVLTSINWDDPEWNMSFDVNEEDFGLIDHDVRILKAVSDVIHYHKVAQFSEIECNTELEETWVSILEKLLDLRNIADAIKESVFNLISSENIRPLRTLFNVSNELKTTGMTKTEISEQYIQPYLY